MIEKIKKECSDNVKFEEIDKDYKLNLKFDRINPRMIQLSIKNNLL